MISPARQPFKAAMFRGVPACHDRRLRAKEHRLGVQQRHGLDGEEETC